MTKVDERGMANLYCFVYFKDADEKARNALETLLRVAFEHGVATGVRKAHETYRSIHSGGCRMLSQGFSCECFLCQMDKLLEQLGDPMDLTEGKKP